MKHNFKLTNPLVIFDLETTGLNSSDNYIVQFGAIKLNIDGTKEQLEFLVKPPIPIPLGASEVHGIYDEDVKDAKPFSEHAYSVMLFMEHCDIGGYNSDFFDIPFLAQELSRNNVCYKFLSDSKKIDMFKSESNIYGRKLTDAYKRYTGLELEDAHDAMNDVNATIAVLEGQMSKLQVDSLDDLISLYDDGKKNLDLAGYFEIKDDEVYFKFGKHKGSKALDNSSYLLWMLRSDFPEETKAKIRELLDI